MISKKRYIVWDSVNVQIKSWDNEYNKEPYVKGNVLSNISTEVSAGQWINIIGKNGAGKSTLATLIAGQRWYYYNLDGVMNYLDEEQYPIVTQSAEDYLVGTTPYEDMMIALDHQGFSISYIEEKIDEVLQLLDIASLKHRDIVSLSGGEKQLVAMASSLLNDSPIIIFDEITSMLEPDAALQVWLQARKLCDLHNKTIVWITQRLEEARAEDLVWIVDNGQIIYDNSVNELFNMNEIHMSRADQLGLVTPFAVHKSRELKEKGYSIPNLLFNMHDLLKAVQALHDNK